MQMGKLNSRMRWKNRGASVVMNILALLITGLLFGQRVPVAEQIWLSGTDAKHTKTWDFYCTGGRNSGYWTTIQVPSHWEQQGFGTYNYGRDNVTYGKDFHYADEKGLYKIKFHVPAHWQGREIYIVMEGSMTDTEVKINGRLAGPVHQGSFYRFKYKISDKLHYRKENLLEITVSKMSAEKTVNNAERFADYWIFGGIFRPVYLEALPVENIAWTTIDARADGHFHMRVHLNNLRAGRQVTALIYNKDNKQVGTAAAITQNDSMVDLRTSVLNPSLWTAETPNLYKVVLQINDGNSTLYETSDKFGFRTIEVRKQDGIYVNGTKIKLKGINRHVFWPEYGRATNPDADLLDVQLIREMNMNAVRCSHYPPDKNFLRICDSLGLYVINELAGWQKAYSTSAGASLLKEMVMRDANHPSILFWSNGNEGGHNKELVNEFAKYDISKRTVIHAHHKPGNAINGIDCNHYEGYYSAQQIMADSDLYMPTEFLHALHDGGGAAGLDDMWELHWKSKRGAGGFIWNFADEGIMRADLDNRLDVNGTNAPDGVVGPHREKEASFHAIKEIYSPVHIAMKELPATFNGRIPVENRYHFTNLKQCRFEYALTNFQQTAGRYAQSTDLKKAELSASDIRPADSGVLQLNLPARWKEYDALSLTAFDPAGKQLYNWIWKIKSNNQLLQPLIEAGKGTEVVATEADSLINVTANGITITIGKHTGLLKKAANDNGNKFSLNGGFIVTGSSLFQKLEHFREANDYVIKASYSGDLAFLQWRMKPSGWVELSYEYNVKGKQSFAGISFNYPEGLVMSTQWLGKGPSRVWKNRLKGVMPGVYESWNNNTQTGNAPWVYPEFKGYYSDIVWMKFNTMEGYFTVASPGNDLFVRLFDFYAINGSQPHPRLPVGNISFLDAIPPTGSKMGISDAEVRQLGPSSDLNMLDKSVTRTLLFYFGITGREK
jgi:hypothetical protein